ncbi:MAG TPA: amino acid adenylation domain-containing protein, partial [Candidatus Angelobacter sp.]
MKSIAYSNSRAELSVTPLSFAQERIWFVSRLNPTSAAYNLITAWRCYGELDADGLSWALNQVVRRHDILRTVFCEDEGVPRQVVKDSFELPLSVLEMPADEIPVFCRNEAARPFDLEKAPAIRAFLIRVSANEQVFQLVVHHILADGWSMALLVREMLHFYGIFTEGKGRPPAPITAQYRDFAHRERVLHEQNHDADKQYWEKQLLGLLPLELPTDRVRPPVSDFRGAKARVQIPAELTSGLRKLAQKERSTLFMVLLASFQLLLARYSGQQDISVGTDVANRTQSDVENLIGSFVNQLVLRTDLSGDPSATELLGRVREVCLGAYAHQSIPFERLVEILNPERSFAHMPFFQVKFVLQNQTEFAMRNMTDDLAAGSKLRLEPISLDAGTSQLDMEVSLWEHRDVIEGWMEYATELFDSVTVMAMIRHWECLMEAMVSRPDRHISQLEMLSDEEIERLVIEWNRTRKDDPRDALVTELFEEQVTKTPHAVAVECNGSQFSYMELNQRANSLANYLLGLGIGPEEKVAVCLQRGPRLLIAILAIWKAGAVYVPLDPTYPAARMAFILEDVQATALLCEEAGLKDIPQTQARVICLDREDAIIAQESSQNPAVKALPANLAYVIYTSGSTGQPKGAMVEHRGMTNHLWAKVDELNLLASDVIAQTAPSSFDISIWQFIVALILGGKVVIIDDATSREGTRLLHKAEKSAVTILETVPALLRSITEYPQQAVQLQHLRWMVCTGEALPRKLCDDWRLLYPNIPLLNAYGPTECSDDVTHFVVSTTSNQPWVYAPIGHPVRNIQVYVLDSAMMPVPVGVTGELYVGGKGVGRGYLNKAGMTAEKFLPDSLSGQPCMRLYRTGDLVRHNSRGELEFIGRADHQVKVRGFRIELGEVESAFRNHPAVREAAVLVREGVLAQARLVAYVVPRNGTLPQIADLKRYLKTVLPDYMVPNAIMLLEKLPLTPNGKLDRRALPEPEFNQADTEAETLRTPTEELVASIWAKILGLRHVGASSNFFELGGHSLLATQVMSQVRQAFGIELELRRLFDQPTVAGLAATIDAVLKLGSADFAPLVSTTRQGNLPLSYAQERLWFLHQLEPENTTYNVSIVVRLNGTLDVDALTKMFAEIVRRHEVLRTRFVMAGDRPVQVIDPHWNGDLERIDLRGLAKDSLREEVERQAIIETNKRFDLSQGPLLRVRLLQLDEADYVLQLTMHHIISDEWGTLVLIQEGTALYETYVNGKGSPLPDLKIQYADYAVWQREWLQGEVLERQLDYWRRQLEDLPVLELPTDWPRPAVRSREGAAVGVHFGSELVRRMQELGRQQGLTLFMVLLGSFQLLLSRYSGQKDIAVGTDVANRTRAELEELIGFFINQLVLRTELRKDETIGEMLGRVREVCLGAYAHQDLPFERLVEEINPERHLGRSPLFQVKLVLNPPGVTEQPFAGVKLSPIGIERSSVKLDLQVNLREVGGELSGECVYATDLYERGTVERMVKHWERLLEGMVKDVEQGAYGV